MHRNSNSIEEIFSNGLVPHIFFSYRGFTPFPFHNGNTWVQYCSSGHRKEQKGNKRGKPRSVPQPNLLQARLRGLNWTPGFPRTSPESEHLQTSTIRVKLKVSTRIGLSKRQKLKGQSARTRLHLHCSASSWSLASSSIEERWTKLVCCSPEP